MLKTAFTTTHSISDRTVTLHVPGREPVVRLIEEGYAAIHIARAMASDYAREIGLAVENLHWIIDLSDERGIAEHWVVLPGVPPEATVDKVCATSGYPTLEAHRARAKAAQARWPGIWGTMPLTPVADVFHPDLIYWLRIVILPQQEETDE